MNVFISIGEGEVLYRNSSYSPVGYDQVLVLDTIYIYNKNSTPSFIFRFWLELMANEYQPKPEEKTYNSLFVDCSAKFK